MKTTGLLVGLALLLGLPVHADHISPFDAVQRGNAFYRAGQYEAAERQYALAARVRPEAAEIHFNQGNAFYKQYDYAKALEHYTRALHTADRTMESSVKYNLGNVMYHQALEAMQTSQDAITPLRSAMRYYRDSLAINRQQWQARYNLELAHRLLRQLQQQVVQMQKNPDNQKQRASPNRGQPLQQQAPHQRTLQQETKPDTPPRPQDRRAQQTPQDDTSTHDSRVQTQQAVAPRELSPEEAKRLVEIIRERARLAESQRQQWRRARIGEAQVDKYW
jgi:Ca-activated chloride channel family protein